MASLFNFGRRFIKPILQDGKPMYIIVGLGNPGREYTETRHNVGFMTLDALADRLGIAITKRGFRSVYGEGRVGTERVVLAKPDTYMNNSGWAVLDLMNWYKAERERLVIIYDDIDLPCGAMRIRKNGSAGTHNGMRSIVEQLGYEDFPRIRIGIGKPQHGLIDHVLGVPSDEDKALLKDACKHGAEAVELIISGEFDRAQEKFNYKPPKKPKKERVRATDEVNAAELPGPADAVNAAGRSDTIEMSNSTESEKPPTAID